MSEAVAAEVLPPLLGGDGSVWGARHAQQPPVASLWRSPSPTTTQQSLGTNGSQTSGYWDAPHKQTQTPLLGRWVDAKASGRADLLFKPVHCGGQRVHMLLAGVHFLDRNPPRIPLVRAGHNDK